TEQHGVIGRPRALVVKAKKRLAPRDKGIRGLFGLHGDEAQHPLVGVNNPLLQPRVRLDPLVNEQLDSVHARPTLVSSRHNTAPQMRNAAITLLYAQMLPAKPNTVHE